MGQIFPSEAQLPRASLFVHLQRLKRMSPSDYQRVVSLIGSQALEEAQGETESLIITRETNTFKLDFKQGVEGELTYFTTKYQDLQDSIDEKEIICIKPMLLPIPISYQLSDTDTLFLTETSSTNFSTFLMKTLQEPSESDHIKQEVIHTYAKITQALAYLNVIGIAREGFSPQAIKVYKDEFKIDSLSLFKGISSQKEPESDFKKYRPPEEQQLKDGNFAKSLKADVWSLGILFCEIVTILVPLKERMNLLQKLDKLFKEASDLKLKESVAKSVLRFFQESGCHSFNKTILVIIEALLQQEPQ